MRLFFLNLGGILDCDGILNEGIKVGKCLLLLFVLGQLDFVDVGLCLVYFVGSWVKICGVC